MCGIGGVSCDKPLVLDSPPVDFRSPDLSVANLFWNAFSKTSKAGRLSLATKIVTSFAVSWLTGPTPSLKINVCTLLTQSKGPGIFEPNVSTPWSAARICTPITILPVKCWDTKSSTSCWRESFGWKYVWNSTWTPRRTAGDMYPSNNTQWWNTF